MTDYLEAFVRQYPQDTIKDIAFKTEDKLTMPIIPRRTPS
jgi:hypothetical protein